MWGAGGPWGSSSTPREPCKELSGHGSSANRCLRHLINIKCINKDGNLVSKVGPGCQTTAPCAQAPPPEKLSSPGDLFPLQGVYSPSRGFIPLPGGLFSPPEGLFPLPARGTPGVLPVSCFTAVTLSLSLGANETGSSSWVSPRGQDLADCVA